MNFQRQPRKHRLTNIGIITALAAFAAWGVRQVNDSGSNYLPPELVFANPGENGFSAATPTRARRNRIVHGNPVALATFRTVTPSGALTALPATGDPVQGTFSPVVDWPLVGIHVVLTPDGRVLSYGTSTAGVRTGYYVYDLWDPQLGLGSDAHMVLANNSAVDVFCNAQLLLPDGNIEMWGGDIVNLVTGKARLLANDDSNVFNPLDNSLVRTGKMWRKRWYATATTLPDGEVYIQGGSGGSNMPLGIGGGKDFPEVRTSTGQFRLLSGASTYYLNDLYPRNWVGPDGKIFGFHYNQMYRVDPGGIGTLTRIGKFYYTDIGATSTAVMFRPGRILQVGGGTNASSASLEAHVVDINSGTPVVTVLPQPAYRRHWGNATVLPDGRVFVSGGSVADNDPINGVTYTSEIYDPVTNAWSLGATAQRMRLYHSAALLLPDATVLTLGGGANGPELNLNAEIYYPGYLFQADGSPASRPIISSAPMTVDPGQKIRIGTPDPAAITRVTLIKTGSNTHSFDMDQRFLELPFTVVNGELEASLPGNRFQTPPGFYMVFVVNAQGVPSEAAILRINIPSLGSATLTVTKTVVNDNGGSKLASDFAFSVNGAAPQAFEADGSNVLTVAAGTYTVTEPAVAGYDATLSGCSGVLAAGGSATCAITNNDQAVIPATLTITKTVVNDNGGSKRASDFSFSVNGAAPVAFEPDGSNVLSVPPGTYTVTEPAVAGYDASLSGCSNITLAAGASATCAIINNDQVPQGNLVVNGDFEINSVPDGSGQFVISLMGWKNKTGSIEVWRNNFGYTPGLNSSYIEVDGAANIANRVYQDINTVAGATYDVSWLYSPRPGNSADSNRYDVYWGETNRIYKMWTDDSTNLTNTRWERITVVVTGSGGVDRLSFRESDADDRGALIDDVQVKRR